MTEEKKQQQEKLKNVSDGQQPLKKYGEQPLKRGHQSTGGNLDIKNPPKGGSGVSSGSTDSNKKE